MAYFVSTGACGGHSVGLRPLRGAPRLALRKPTVPPIPLRSIASPDSSLRAMRLALRAPSCAILVPLGLAVGHPARPSALPRAPFFAHSRVLKTQERQLVYELPSGSSPPNCPASATPSPTSALGNTHR